MCAELVLIYSYKGGRGPEIGSEQLWRGYGEELNEPWRAASDGSVHAVSCRLPLFMRGAPCWGAAPCGSGIRSAAEASGPPRRRHCRPAAAQASCMQAAADHEVTLKGRGAVDLLHAKLDERRKKREQRPQRERNDKNYAIPCRGRVEW